MPPAIAPTLRQLPSQPFSAASAGGAGLSLKPGEAEGAADHEIPMNASYFKDCY